MTKKQLQNFLKSSGIKVDFNKMSNCFVNIKDFEAQFLNSLIDKNKICEAIRITATVSNQTNFIYITKEITNILTRYNFELTVTLTDQKYFLLSIQAIKRIIDEPYILFTSMNRIEKNYSKIIKFFLLNKKYSCIIDHIPQAKLLKELTIQLKGGKKV